MGLAFLTVDPGDATLCKVGWESELPLLIGFSDSGNGSALGRECPGLFKGSPK